jgi:hypothetical protein
MTQEKDINYWKNNCEEEYITTPISVLRYISELEKIVAYSQTEISDEEIETIGESYRIFYNGKEGNGNLVYKHYIQGIKWCREQLKLKNDLGNENNNTIDEKYWQDYWVNVLKRESCATNGKRQVFIDGYNKAKEMREDEVNTLKERIDDLENELLEIRERN